MQPKEYLKRYRTSWFEIERKKREIADLEEILLIRSIDYTKDKVQTTPKDTMADIISMTADLRASLDADIENLIRIRTGVVQTINAVPDERLKAILTMRYISGETWEQIADELHITSRWVHQLHGDALENVGKIINEKMVTS